MIKKPLMGFYRSGDDYLVAGVLGGFAEKYALSSRAVRAVFVLACLVFPLLFLLYFLLAILVKVANPGHPSSVEHHLENDQPDRPDLDQLESGYLALEDRLAEIEGYLVSPRYSRDKEKLPNFNPKERG